MTDDYLDALRTDPVILERIELLEGSAKELRDAATQLMHAQYFPLACERMSKVADQLERSAKKLRAEAG